jgi:hypothetical protein
MEDPSHMSLRDRKAYVLQATFLKAVRGVAPDAPLEEIDLLAGVVKRLSIKVADAPVVAGSQSPLDAFLTEAVERAEKVVIDEAGPDGVSDSARQVFDELKRLASTVKCETCGKGAVCNGLGSDDVIVAADAGGHCIAEIKQAIARARRLTDSEYVKHVANDVSFPRLVFQTTAVGDPPTYIPVLAIAINGNTEFEDGPDGKVSHIDVRVAPAALNRASVAGLPYLMLHEVFCHGYQMMLNPDQRPNKGAIPDPVSEGMVDKAAIESLARVSATEAGSDAAGQMLAEGDMKVAQMLHLARGSLDMEPRFPEAPSVRLGVEVAKAIEALYTADPPNAEAMDDMIALACSLNAAGWHFADRYRGLARLLRGLQVPRDPFLVALLLDFRRKRDANELVNYITIN